MSHILLCLVTLASIVAAQPSRANPPDFRLQVVPAIVYKVDDPGNTRTSSFTFEIAVICSTDCELTPISANVELSSGGVAVERQQWTAEMLARTKNVSHRILPNTPAWSSVRLFTLPEAFDVRLYFRCPQALEIDSAVVRVTVADANGRRAEQMLAIPIRYYQQKTALIFPFRGRGIVGQDWITNGGHGGYWNQFAMDVGGLDQNYAALRNDAGENSSDAGWGREILAPAGGTVTYARNDIPDNPGPDTITYMAQHDPIMAFLGNSVIVDHGNSEYSVMMHMQQGSVTVRVGERVAAGEIIGRLGNSGDAFGPHLHYQLQAGPQVFRDQSLPFRFQNIDVPLFRGKYFNAR